MCQSLLPVQQRQPDDGRLTKDGNEPEVGAEVEDDS